MKKLLAFIIFLLFLLLLWFSWNWYKDNVICCGEVEKVVQVEYGPLIFECAKDGKVITNNLWPEKKKEILAGKKPGKSLLIVAPYFNGEDESYALVRAVKVADLFKPELNDSELAVDIRKAGDCEKTKVNLMHESRYKWVTNNGYIVEKYDHTVIHYAYDSTQEVKEGNIKAYFDDLAAELKSTGDSVTVTGHTDADGTAEYNMTLGLERANEFKQHLLSRGVSEDKITVESKGETMPVDTSGTPEAKQKNRRVEIRINK